MKLEHDKYQSNVNNINILMFVLLVIDPRRKLSYIGWVVEYSYAGEQGNLLFLKIKVTLRNLFNSYVSSMPSSKQKEK